MNNNFDQKINELFYDWQHFFADIYIYYKLMGQPGKSIDKKLENLAIQNIAQRKNIGYIFEYIQRLNKLQNFTNEESNQKIKDFINSLISNDDFVPNDKNKNKINPMHNILTSIAMTNNLETTDQESIIQSFLNSSKIEDTIKEMIIYDINDKGRMNKRLTLNMPIKKKKLSGTPEAATIQEGITSDEIITQDPPKGQELSGTPEAATIQEGITPDEIITQDPHPPTGQELSGTPEAQEGITPDEIIRQDLPKEQVLSVEAATIQEGITSDEIITQDPHPPKEQVLSGTPKIATITKEIEIIERNRNDRNQKTEKGIK